MVNKTITYYDKHADLFSKNTLFVEMHEIQDKFLSYLCKNDLILDFGCGSGRDTNYFLKKGFRVEATDGSEEICKKASKETGITVRHELFEDLDKIDVYDAVWACASILHLPYKELSNVLNRVDRAMKRDAFFYCSFKYGEFEGIRNGRYFTDFTEERMQKLLSDLSLFEMVDQFITSDARPGREKEQWLNIILKSK